jgi:hypothetical protein
VFTARYGLIACIKQIYNCGGECLQRGTDCLLIYSRLCFVFGSLNSEEMERYCVWLQEQYGLESCAVCYKDLSSTPILLAANRHNNILSTALQLSISQKALGTLPEDGNVLPKHVGAAIHN